MLGLCSVRRLGKGSAFVITSCRGCPHAFLPPDPAWSICPALGFPPSHHLVHKSPVFASMQQASSQSLTESAEGRFCFCLQLCLSLCVTGGLWDVLHRLKWWRCVCMWGVMKHTLISQKCLRPHLGLTLPTACLSSINTSGQTCLGTTSHRCLRTQWSLSPAQESATLSTGYNTVDDQAWQGTLESAIVSDSSPQLVRGPP